MCELFGYSSSALVFDSELLRQFFSNSRVHRDGWGLFKVNNRMSCLYRDTRPAYESKKNQWVIDHTIPAKTAIAHIRYATTGTVCAANVHPFQRADSEGNVLTLAHNGCFRTNCELESYIDSQLGSTDSERILLFIVDKLDQARERKGSSLDEKERIRIIDDALSVVSRTNRINILLSDGDLFYVRGNIKHRLYMAHNASTAFFSTRILPVHGLEWSEIASARTLVFKQNELIYTGRRRGSIFEPMKLPERGSHYSIA